MPLRSIGGAPEDHGRDGRSNLDSPYVARDATGRPILEFDGRTIVVPDGWQEHVDGAISGPGHFIGINRSGSIVEAHFVKVGKPHRGRRADEDMPRHSSP